MNEEERKAWNENAKKVQDYHRSQDQPFPYWDRKKPLGRNIAVAAVVAVLAIPYLIAIGRTSD
jgi:hypothetical protein